MSQPVLCNTLVNDILDHLGCPRKSPSLRYLNQLINAYIRKVPWESVSRIVKRQTTLEIKDCPRWPEEFWQDAMKYNFGGTCFESSLAFYSLLISLGYVGYLTVNDMGTSHACHAAVIVLLKDKKYLVDITIPLHSAVQVNPDKTTKRQTSYQNYTIRPVQPDRYEVERSHHPHRNAFSLIDIPIRISTYHTIVENDYKETGLFLTSVVMVKFIDNKTWRFMSDLQPFRLESFNRSGKNEYPLESELLPTHLTRVFQLPQDKISAALAYIQRSSIKYRDQLGSLPMVMERASS